MSNAAVQDSPDWWAELRTRSHTVRYRRLGAGPPVLVLGGAPSESLWPEVVQHLSERFRLIVPEPPVEGCVDAWWVNDFVEGLGMSDLAVVATDQFCMPALELVLLDAERIARVVLVPVRGADDRPSAGTVETRPPGGGGGAVPLLVVRRGLPALEATSLISDFLSDVPAN